MADKRKRVSGKTYCAAGSRNAVNCSNKSGLLRRFATPVDPLAAKSMLVSTLGKIERYRIFNVFIVKNNFIWERFCLILCIPYKFWGAILWKNSEVVSTGEKNSGLTQGAVVTHQTWMLFLASSMKEYVWKKDRSSQVQIPSTLVVYLVFSADQNGQFDRFERFCVPLRADVSKYRPEA